MPHPPLIQRTLVLLKPDAVRRRLAGELISRFEAKGLRILGMKMLQFDAKLSARHYAEHLDKPFYAILEKFIVSGPSVALALEGPNAIDVTRTMMGATSHIKAVPGTIRGDYSLSTTENLVHGSDSPERAAHELELFFSKEELFG